EFGEAPASVGGKVVHTGNPIGFHRGLLFLCIFAPIAFDLDDEVKQVFFATTVIDSNDEVGPIDAVLTAISIRNFETKVVIFYIRSNAWMRLGDATKFALPIAVENDPINVAAIRHRFPTIFARR